jgi:hypothetical protein
VRPAQDAPPALLALCAKSGLVRALWQPFADLSEQARSVWIACMWAGLPVDFVADLQGLTPAAVCMDLRETARSMDAHLEGRQGLAMASREKKPAWACHLFVAAVERQILLNNPSPSRLLISPAQPPQDPARSAISNQISG